MSAEMPNCPNCGRSSMVHPSMRGAEFLNCARAQRGCGVFPQPTVQIDELIPYAGGGSLLEVAGELDALALRMRSTAAKMEYYGGFDGEMKQHADELAGAANMARTWAKGIRVKPPNAQGELHEGREGALIETPTPGALSVSSNALFGSLEKLIKEKGSLRVTHSPGGSGMGFYWSANVGGWPYCSAGTLAHALESLRETHSELEREALQKRINEIDGASGL